LHGLAIADSLQERLRWPEYSCYLPRAVFKCSERPEPRRTPAPVEPKPYSGSRIPIHRGSKMSGGRGDIGEIFRVRGGFGPLASGIWTSRNSPSTTFVHKARRADGRLSNCRQPSDCPYPRDGPRNADSSTWAAGAKDVRCFRRFYRLCRSRTCRIRGGVWS
jgi:hypothetical protein